MTPSSPPPAKLAAESTSSSSISSTRRSDDDKIIIIEREIVSEEEMAMIEAAFVAPRPSLSSSVRSVRSITLLAKRHFPTTTTTKEEGKNISLYSGGGGDIEDAGGGDGGSRKREKQSMRRRKGGVRESLLYRFRSKRGISVTDITATEWCEKQMEFNLLVGKPEPTKAMKAGSARHAILEKEVIKRVKIPVRTVEDAWAIKILNFLVGVNQLLSDGLTRELPLIGFVEGAWMVGVVDEIRMPLQENEKPPTFIDTKTRVQPTVPSEPQQRNGRLQLMCYKYLWDKLVSDNFPSRKFFDFFSLNRNSILSEEIRANTAKLGFPAETLDDLVRYLRDSCSKLLPVHDQLVLRYELQKDHSLLREDKFEYNSNWVKTQIKSILELWLGEREAEYTSEEERWKCKHCGYELQKDHSLLREDKFEYNSNWVKTQIKSILELWLGEREAEYTSEEERWKCKHCGFASLCPINLKPDDRPVQD